jgi:hypothetical protein
MKHWFQKQRPTTVLGLSLDGTRLDGVVVRRTNGSAQVARSCALQLTQDVLAHDTETAAREIREQLDKQEIHERRCTVCLPLSWVLAVSSPMPDLPEEDLSEFLVLEAERAFPYPPEDLFIQQVKYKTGMGIAHTAQIAVARENVIKLDQVLRAAKLQPMAFSVGLPLLNEATAAKPQNGVTLGVDRTQIGLLVTSGGGIAALRTLATCVEATDAGPRIDTDSLARELRITLGQLPADVRESIHQLNILGGKEAADMLAAGIQAKASSMGLATDRLTRYAANRLKVTLPADVGVSAELTLAVRYLTQSPGTLDFLPPRVSAWQTLAGRYSSRKLAYTGIAVGTVAALVILAFSVQQFQLMRLESQWKILSPRVREVEDLRGQIKRFRPWFDESMRNLSIMRRLAEVFPEDGTVTAKTLELRDPGTVSCSGTARDSAALMKTLDQLRGTPEVTDVQVDQLRGRAPIQFNFNFHWAAAGRQP